METTAMSLPKILFIDRKPFYPTGCQIIYEDTNRETGTIDVMVYQGDLMAAMNKVNGPVEIIQILYYDSRMYAVWMVHETEKDTHFGRLEINPLEARKLFKGIQPRTTLITGAICWDFEIEEAIQRSMIHGVAGTINRNM